MENTGIQQQLAIPDNFSDSITLETEQRIHRLKSYIDIHDRNRVIAYGSEEQASIGKFYDFVINGSNTAESDASSKLANVISKINDYQNVCLKEENGFFSIFKKRQSKLNALQSKYKEILADINQMTRILQSKEMELRKFGRELDILYKQNESVYELLTLIIYAGDVALKEEKEKLSKMSSKSSTLSPMEQQKINDYKSDIDFFERRLYNLKLARAIAIQQAPQIRLIQNGANSISDSIRSTIFSSIPLWKSQMAIALSIEAINEETQVLNSVNTATNIMLLNNVENVKKISIETRKIEQQGIADTKVISKLNHGLLDILLASSEIIANNIEQREDGNIKLRENEEMLRNAIIQGDI